MAGSISYGSDSDSEEEESDDEDESEEGSGSEEDSSDEYESDSDEYETDSDEDASDDPDAKAVEETPGLDPRVAAARAELRQVEASERAEKKLAAGLQAEADYLGERVAAAARGERYLVTGVAEEAQISHVPPAEDDSGATARDERIAEQLAAVQQRRERRHASQKAEAAKLAQERDDLRRKHAALLRGRHVDPVELSKLPPPVDAPNAAHVVVDHYERTLAAERANIDALRAKVEADASKPREKVYAGELGPTTYDASQLEAYKLARRLVGELVDETLDVLLSRSQRTIGELEQEYKQWKSSHNAMARKLARQVRTPSHAITMPFDGPGALARGRRSTRSSGGRARRRRTTTRRRSTGSASRRTGPTGRGGRSRRRRRWRCAWTCSAMCSTRCRGRLAARWCRRRRSRAVSASASSSVACSARLAAAAGRARASAG